MEIVLSLENRRGNDTLFRSWFLFSFSFIILTQTKKINSLCILYWNQAKRSRYQNFYSRT